MDKRDPFYEFQQIYSHAVEAVEICQGKSRKDLDEDRLLNLALTRLLEIIGEAASRMSDQIRTEYPDLPWMQMIAARNRLIHGYDSVDFDILWAIVNTDLPALIIQIEEILQTPRS